MGKITEVIQSLNNQLLPYTPDEVKKAFNDRLLKLEYTQKEGITVTDVQIDLEGDVIVTFVDNDADFMEVLFSCSNDADGDGEEDCFAMILGDDADDEVDIIDLDNMEPPTIEGAFSLFMDLTDVSWMNKSTFGAIFNAGDIGAEDLKDSELIGSDGALGEKFVRRKRGQKKVVFRGGKKQRVAVVTRRGKQRLSSKQRAGLRKARRKAHKAGATRKRKRSFKRRKASGVKRRTRLKGEIR